MRKLLFVFSVVLLGMLVLAQFEVTKASPTADCEAFGTGAFDVSISDSIGVSFTCTADAAVFFGVCDSGPIQDDIFNLIYDGNVVASNFFDDDGREFVTINQASVTAGTYPATIRNLQDLNPDATYSYGISTDRSAVLSYMQSACGIDFIGAGPSNGCSKDVPIFTTDAAPTDGRLEFRIMLGNEDSREVSGLLQSWDITAGTQINNEFVTNVSGPRWVRLYWQPAGDSDWYMLTSQYWNGDGTTASEYGISCGPSNQPSYHTSFASAVPVENICFDLLNGCN